MGAMASQIISLTIVYWTVYSDADQKKHQSLASLAFVWGIHRWPVNSPHKWPVTRKMFPLDDVIMITKWSDILEYQIYCTAMPAAEQKSYFELTHKRLENILASQVSYG